MLLVVVWYYFFSLYLWFYELWLVYKGVKKFRLSLWMGYFENECKMEISCFCNKVLVRDGFGKEW